MYRGVIVFVITLLASHFAWKYSVIGDDGGAVVTLFGADISAPFDFLTHHISVVVQSILGACGVDTVLQDTTICHPNNHCTTIIWGCSGVKQGFILTMTMLTARRPHIHKLWYTAIGLVVVYLFNIARVTFLTWIVRDYPARFDLWHEHITKYLFYAIIFAIWVAWDDVVAPRLSKKGGKQQHSSL